MFDDFLAIKYLRNIIVHARWKPEEKQWLEERGFPLDTRELSEQHWTLMDSVNKKMTMYIALTQFLGSPGSPSAKVVELQDRRDEDVSGILKKRDMPRIFLGNLARINSRIYPDVESAALTEGYRWSAGLGRNEAEALS